MAGCIFLITCICSVTSVFPAVLGFEKGSKCCLGADQCWSCFWLWFAESSANTELLAVITLNARGENSKDTDKPNHVSSDVNWKLHQSVLGNPIQEGLGPTDVCKQKRSCTSNSRHGSLPGRGEALRKRQNWEVLWIQMLHTSSWEVQELNTAL